MQVRDAYISNSERVDSLTGLWDCDFLYYTDVIILDLKCVLYRLMKTTNLTSTIRNLTAPDLAKKRQGQQYSRAI